MKDKVRMVVFIVILGSIFTTTLVAVDNYTAPIIARNEELKRKASILKAFVIPYKEEEIEQIFLENVTVKGEDEKSYYVSQDGTIAFLFTGSGLWGPIKGALAMNQDMKTISRVEIIYQEETPGLGSRIIEEAFLNRFKDKTFAPHLKMLPEGQAKGNDEIDGITGATMSSEALIAILNNQYEQFSVMISGE